MERGIPLGAGERGMGVLTRPDRRLPHSGRESVPWRSEREREWWWWDPSPHLRFFFISFYLIFFFERERERTFYLINFFSPLRIHQE
jgi:hypothetical protein